MPEAVQRFWIVIPRAGASGREFVGALQPSDTKGLTLDKDAIAQYQLPDRTTGAACVGRRNNEGSIAAIDRPFSSSNPWTGYDDGLRVGHTARPVKGSVG